MIDRIAYVELQLHGVVVFFFNDTATTEIYTLSLHDALPISAYSIHSWNNISDPWRVHRRIFCRNTWNNDSSNTERSEEHTSELQSRQYLACRLLLEKKKKSKI